MGMPHLMPGQVEQVSNFVARYITGERGRYAPRGAALTPEQQERMRPFFTSLLLDSTRIIVLEGARVKNPDFYPMLLQMGFRNLPDFSQMSAITFSDVVVSHEPFSDALLFHELVHVEQYRQLGIERFAALYVRGFLAGGGYDGIPLERNAYALGARFEAASGQTFLVADEVATWLREGRF